MTIYFLKDLVNQTKKNIKNDCIQHFQVPQYNSLSLEKIMEFISHYPDMADYLPDEIDLPKTPKQWMVNVIAAVLGTPFKNWVGVQIEQRNAEMADKREMMITMDREMAQN